MNPMHAPGSSILSLAYFLFIFIYHLTSQTQNFKATASEGKTAWKLSFWAMRMVCN